ncbi:hypothetical protein D4T97_016765 [Siminovitchia acidinfaciens]|uniref:Uncharacterized protein n=1 Tax=Siminovitchia acidinfaciens TaxID=2321395 RepID=A0A429XVL3_9BACI|nr:hypothetical protein D4T97_016765 [Siminovitchia acidinfaciens]
MLLFSACDRQDASPNLPEPSPFQALADTNSGVTLGLEQQEYHAPVQMMNMKIENASVHLFSYGNFLRL